MPKLKKKSATQRSRERNNNIYQKRLNSVDFLKEENLERKQRHKIEREKNEDIRIKENLKRKGRHEMERQTEDIREKENIERKKRHKIERKNEDIRGEENLQRKNRHKIERCNEEIKNEENVKRKIRHEIERENEDVRIEENLHRQARHEIERENVNVRIEENLIRKRKHQIERENEDICNKENLKRKELRSDESHREMEKLKKSANKKSRIEKDKDKKINNTEFIRQIRSVPEYREHERVQDREARQLVRASQIDIAPSSNNSNWDQILTKFNAEVKLGPTEVCVSFGGYWFASSIKCLKPEYFKGKNIPDDFLCKVYYLHKLEKFKGLNSFCGTCYKYVRNSQIPKLCLANGLDFPEIPEILKSLTVLEERLCAIRLPFMQIRSLGYERQCSLRGNVVNVPVSIDSTVSVLPRTFDNTLTIQVKLKRKLSYKHHYMIETIRPNKVRQACEFLITTPLYISEGITLRDIDENLPETEEYIVDRNDLSSPHPDINNKPNTSNHEEQIQFNCLEDLDENADQEPLNPGGQETLVQDENEIENLALAPAEGQRPIGLLLDTKAEEMSFPTIYCGHPRNPTVYLTYNNIIKSEMRRFDRRAAVVCHLLYCYKKQEITKISNAISVCLRKRKQGTGNYCVAQMLDRNFINNLVLHNDGYRFLQGVRSSPAYWEKEKKKLSAMIRQCGIPTFFFTLSAAESKWGELLKMLMKIVDGKIVTEEEALNINYSEKARLIRTDPITCARYFDYRTRCLIKTWKSASGPFKDYKVLDFYQRVEFQQRGSPHIHGLLWLENAPQFLEEHESQTNVIEFIDKFITCDGKNKLVSNLVYLQIHHHTATCHIDKRKNKKCRFNIPYPPMNKTVILNSLQNITKDESKKYTDIRQKISDLLAETIQTENDLTFDEFLTKLNISYDEYILAIRAGVKRNRVFLKRRPLDCMVNGFNDQILSMHRANMDLQYILDPYSLVQYIINYINKSNRGMSKLLNDLDKELASGNLSLKEKLRAIGNKFVNASEISAQEAAYHVLGMPLSKSSRSHIFVNTSLPEERVKMLKSEKELRKLEPDSSDIFVTNIIDKYIKRPLELENYTLASFASDIILENHHVNAEDEDNNEHDELEDNVVEIQKSNRKSYKIRTKSCILRYRRFDVHKDVDNYFREQVMLFLPWRDEENELINANCQEIYKNNREQIETEKKKFNCFSDDHFIENLLNQAEKGLDNAVDQNDALIADNIDDEFAAYALDQPDCDILVQGGGNPIRTNDDTAQTFLLPKELSSDEYNQLCRSLNDKQRQYLMHIKSHFSDNFSSPLYNFVSGGAGVGKSRLIEIIYQTLTKYFNQFVGCDPSKIKVLICAPTGKAAFNVNGVTLHQALSLPVNQAGYEMSVLNNELLHNLNLKYSDLKLMIIDEISMVGARMLTQISSRLQQIFGSKENFGGISLLLVGDLRQLSPVGDSKIFKENKRTMKNPYAVFQGTHLWDMFKMFQLTEIMRQKNDLTFAQALNSMASCTMSPKDISLFQSRVVSILPPHKDKSVYLFYSNNEVNNFNEFRLSKMNSECAISNAFDVVYGNGAESAKNHLKYSVSEKKTADTYGLCMRLTLKLGARYMMTNNVNTSDGLVNGATGILKLIDYGTNSKTGIKIPLRVWIEFDESRIGIEARNVQIQLIKKRKLMLTLTPIDTIKKVIATNKNSSLQLYRRQFPLIVAEGITIHKSQGSTYENVIVTIGPRGLSRAALYVACSRATQAEGLLIHGKFLPPKREFKTKINDDCTVFEEIKRLETTAKLITRFENLNNMSGRRIMYHNVQSLNKHFLDLLSDPMFATADLLLLVETWTLSTDVYKLPPNLQEISRIDCEKSRTAGGVFIAASNMFNDKISNIIKLKSSEQKGHIELIRFDLDDTTYFVFYNSPQASFRMTEEIINQALQGSCPNKIFIGDMNIDMNNKNNNRYFNLFDNLNLQCKTSKNIQTTYGGTNIDWCFSNLSKVQTILYASTFSYHKPLCIIFSDIMSAIIKDQNVVNKGTFDEKLNDVKDSTCSRIIIHKDVKINKPTTNDIIINDKNVIVNNENGVTNKLQNNDDEYNHDGLFNTDCVSCYSNSAIQCLLSIPEFRKSVEKRNSDINRYIYLVMDKISRSTEIIRSTVNEMFSETSQQDVQEFLQFLFEKLDEDFVSNLIFTMNEASYCDLCGNSNSHHESKMFYFINIPITNEISFNDLLENQRSNKPCNTCNQTINVRNKLQHVKKYLLLVLSRIVLINGSVVKVRTKITKLNPNMVKIDNHMFKIKCLIKHQGEDNNGHYISVIRQRQDFWIECNDEKINTLNNFNSPLGEEYIIILEKKCN